ncbi:MAG: glycosyltransferase 87 family protein [Actinomycetota bacterium]
MQWLICSAVVAVALYPLLAWRFFFHHLPIDLAVYRAGGRAVVNGTSLYSKSFGGRTLPVKLPFTYPPFSALLFVLMAFTPVLVLRAAWFVASFAGFVYLSRASISPLGRTSTVVRGVLLGIFLAVTVWTVPITDTLWFGQINLVLAGLIAIDCVRNERYRGVLVGLATAIKLTPALFILYFAFTRQWRAAVRAATTTFVCTGLAWAILPKDSRTYWTNLVFDTKRPGSPAFWSNQSINGLIARLHGPSWVFIVFAIPVMVLALVRARAAHSGGNEIEAITLVGLATILAAPISWLASIVWIIPAIGCLLAARRGHRIAAIIVSGLFIARLSMLGSKVLGGGIHRVFRLTLEDFYVVVILLLVAFLPFEVEHKNELNPERSA